MMTVEFLRARLLSERSVSRAARQRADQLASRVMELEEQLRIVTIQRKKAEKAAAGVLAILETQGIGDLSESIDYSSDGEVPYDDTRKEYESSTASRMERSEVEDGLSGTEPEISPSQGRSISWKSHSNSPDSQDKPRAKQIKQRQRQRSFMTLQSSSKHQLGKSCRKIKRTDGGSSGEHEKDKPTLLDAQGNGEACFNYYDDQPVVSVETSRASRGKTEGAVVDISDSHHVGGDLNRPTEARLCCNGSGKDENMERVLEKQALLINQFQAEENAQKEWEEKYNGKAVSTLGDHDPGHPTAENNSQSKKKLSEFSDRPPDYSEKTTPRAVQASSAEEATVESISDKSEEASNAASSNGSMPRDTSAASSGRYSNVRESHFVRQQFDDMVAKDTENISQKVTASVLEHHDTKSHPLGNITIKEASLQTNFLVGDHCKLPELGPRQKNKAQPQGSQASSSSLEGVLEALQRAKLSLTQELSKMPSPSHGRLALAAQVNPQTRAIGTSYGLDIPIGSASLFRLPTDLIPRAEPSLSFPAYRPEVGYPPNSYDYLNPNPVSASGRGYTDNYFVSGTGAHDAHMYVRATSDLLADRTSFGREASNTYSDTTNGMPLGGRYALFGSDQTRSNLRML